MQDSRSIDMLRGSIFAGLVRFSIPLAFSNLLQLLFNAADVIVIGRFGSNLSLAAVGADAIIAGMFSNILLNFSAGATVMSAGFIGSGQTHKVFRVVHVSMALALATGFAFMLGTFALIRPWLHLMQTPESVFGAALQYMYFWLPSLPAMAVYNFGASLLRAKGDTQRPLFILIAAGVVNVVLNLFFVIRLKMDAGGVALATTISQYISAVALTFCLMRERDCFRFCPHLMFFEKRTIASLLRIGIPSALQSLVFNISNLVVQASVNGFGPIAMAGNAAAQSIEAFVWVCMNSVSQAGMTFTSQNTGARDFDRVRRVNAISNCTVFVVGMTLGIGAAVAGRHLLSIYTDDAGSIACGLNRLHLICGLYGICGVMDTLSFNIRGMGWSTLPSVVSMIGACGLRLVWIGTLFQHPHFHTLHWLFLTYPVSWSVTAAANVVCFAIVWRKMKTKKPPA